jgi:hypothetical protein
VEGKEKPPYYDLKAATKGAIYLKKRLWEDLDY